MKFGSWGDIKGHYTAIFRGNSNDYHHVWNDHHTVLNKMKLAADMKAPKIIYRFTELTDQVSISVVFPYTFIWHVGLSPTRGITHCY